MLLPVGRTRVEVALVDLVFEREPVDVGREVLEQSLLDPVGRVDDVCGEQVGQRVRAGGRAHLRDVVVVGDDGELDLVLVRGVVGLDEELGLLLQGGAGPKGEGAAVIHAFRAGLGETGLGSGG